MTAGLNDAEKRVVASTNAMSQKFKAVGTIMTIAGTAITAAFGLIIKKTMDAGDQFHKMSLRTGISVENLSALAYAAKISGTSIEGLELGIKFLTKGMDDASKGTGTAKDAFKELGISITDTEGNLRPTVDVLKEAATKIAAIENPTKQAALAMELFGARSGTQLIPLLKMGGAGIEELMAKAKELGITMSTESAAAAAEFKDRLTDLKGSLAGAGRTIGEVLIPPLTKLAEKAIEIIKKIKEWADAHKPLVETIVKFVAIAGGIMVVLGPILMALPLLTTLFSGLGIVIAAICSPIGLVVAAAIALYVAWKENFGGIRDFTDKIMEKLKPSFERLEKLIDNVKTALRWLGLELGILKEDLAGGGGAVGAFADEVDNMADQIKEKLGGTIEELKKMADLKIIFQPAEEAIKKIIDSMTSYEKQLLAINKRYDEAIEKIKTYITGEEELKAAIDKLNEGRKAEITLLDREKTALEKVAEAKQKLIDLTKSLTDKIYEFTHTKYEVTLRDINREYDLLVENAKKVYESEYELGKAIKIINEERQKEIGILKESNVVKGETIDKNIELAESIVPIIEKTKEAIEVTKQLGILGGESWEGFTTQIKHATTALSNFTKEGVAAAITQIKMHFKPIISSLIDDINNLTGVWKKMAEYQLAAVKKSMQEQIDLILYGYKEYQKILASLGGGSKIGSYQAGTPYVPRTGLALLHQGEAVIPAGQNTYNQQKSYSPSIVINVSGNGNVSEIKRAVEQALEESTRQYNRRGFELVPGMV